MSKIDDSGPAFPCSEHKIPDGWTGPSDGLTKREYFAGLAMQGYLSTPTGAVAFNNPSRCAEWAVQQADALLTELRKEQSREQE